MTSLRLFLDGCVLQYRGLFAWSSPLGYVTTKVLAPLFQLIFFVELGVFATGAGNATYFAIGNALQITAMNGVHGVTMTVGMDREFGSLPYILASPANRLAAFLGRASVHVLDGASSVVMGFLAAGLLYGLNLRHADIGVLALSVLIISASTCGLGLLMGSLSLITRDVLFISNSVYFLLLILCGINFPVASLPGVIQVVSYALPMTRGVLAARAAVDGASLSHVWTLLAGEVLIGAIYVTLGYVVFRLLEYQARRGGLQDAV